MLPAACGAPGTRISYGKWTRRGWMGERYLVAREFDPDNPPKSVFRGRLPRAQGLVAERRDRRDARVSPW